MSKDLQPTKSGLKTGYNCTNGQTSQIPGLSSDANIAPEEKARGRRVGVLETDSDYVKLAKQGGQKDLLWHEDVLPSKPVQYTPPNWFCCTSDTNNKQSVIKDDFKKSGVGLRHVEAPFGTDDDSASEKGDQALEKGDNNNDKAEQIDEPISPIEDLSLSPDQNMSSSFKKLTLDNKTTPVNMSKLLSFGYAEEEKDTPSRKLSK